MTASGSDDKAIILRSGADSEMVERSGPRNDAAIADTPGVARGAGAARLLGTLCDHQRPQALHRHVLDIANRYFPEARLTERDVISTWAGLRPLLASPRGTPLDTLHSNKIPGGLSASLPRRLQVPSDISRSHKIRSPEPGWWDVAGGKLTTYRLIAEQTVDQVAKTLTRSKGLNREIAPCRTASEPLLASPPQFSGLLPPEFCREAVQHFCANEWAVHLDDVMIRRTSWRHYFPDADARAAQAADWMADFFGWTESIRKEEITRLIPR